MVDGKSRATRRAKGFAVFAIIAAMLALAAMRVATGIVAAQAGGPLTFAGTIPAVAADLLRDPLSVNFADARVMATGAGTAAALVLLALAASAGGERLGNEDTGREHGDDRLATESEMKSLRDRRRFTNNVLYSRRCWLARSPMDKHCREVLDGRNLNCITLGISGLGKTFNLVWPDLLQSVGDALEPMPYGVRNVPGNIARKIGIRGDAPDGGLYRREVGKNGTSGFDVFCTDPKGDNVRDVGPLYERAGYKVKVLDTIDFKRGLHYNPLAYIKTRSIDLKPVEEVACDVRATGPASSAEGAEAVTCGLARPLKNGMSLDVAGGAGVWHVSASLNLATRQDEAPGDAGEHMTLDEVEAEMASGKELDAKRREQLGKARELAWIREESGYGEASRNTVDIVSYKRSSGTVEVAFRNACAYPLDADVAIELDGALVVDGVVTKTNGSIEWPKGADGEEVASGTVIWHVEASEPRRRAHGGSRQSGAGRMVAEKLVLHVHVRSAIVPDGVDLTKTVDCIVTNLKGTDAASNGSEDPFWEDTKRLCFMSLVAYMFERYEPKYRTLPEMMAMLNMALAPSGNPQDPSPLSSLMEMWETGRRYVGAGVPRGRYSTGTARYEPSGNPAHSRERSLALHCYHAFSSGAPETVQSVIISCQAALVNLITEEAKEFLAYDELELDTLGDPDQRQVIFCVTKDTNSPFDFLTALVVYQAIDLAQDKAYKVYGGKLPRHVRFVLDEAANIGKIPILVRALAVVRSRNISISMYLQSKAQLALVYGEKEADVIFDNCTTIVFLGAQTEETLEEMSKKVGNETVQTRMFQRSFNSSAVTASSSSEQIQSNERRVKSASQMSRMEKGWLMLFVFNAYPVFDHKYETFKHPYYAYINPESPRPMMCAPAVCRERFDYGEYRQRSQAGLGRAGGEVAGMT